MSVKIRLIIKTDSEEAINNKSKQRGRKKCKKINTISKVPNKKDDSV